MFCHLQANEMLRRDLADKSNLVDALSTIVRQVVVLLSNKIATAAPTSISSPLSGESVLDATSFLNNLLDALLSDPVVRALFPPLHQPSTQHQQQQQQQATSSSAAMPRTPSFESMPAKRLTPGSRKSSSNVRSMPPAFASHFTKDLDLIQGISFNIRLGMNCIWMSSRGAVYI